MGRYAKPYLEFVTVSKPKNVLNVGAGFAELINVMELNRIEVQTALCERQSAVGIFSQTIELDGI
jgi:hypothetical protein